VAPRPLVSNGIASDRNNKWTDMRLPVR